MTSNMSLIAAKKLTWRIPEGVSPEQGLMVADYPLGRFFAFSNGIWGMTEANYHVADERSMAGAQAAAQAELARMLQAMMSVAS